MAASIEERLPMVNSPHMRAAARPSACARGLALFRERRIRTKIQQRRLRQGCSMVVYDAFISYSHAKDRMVATRLQRLMQRLGKPWYVRRAMRVFRDDTSLSATPHLWPSIEEALKASRFFVLIASSEAAASRWVFQETEYWIEHKSADTLLLALSAGELSWDKAANDFVWSGSTPLPQSLKGRFASEPKWVDLRAFRDATHGSTEELLAAADLAAAIRGIPKEDLLSEEVRQHRRAMMLSGFAAACLFVLAVAATWQWREAVAQRDRAEKNLGATIESANDLVLDLARRLRRTLGVPTVVVDDLLKKVGGLQQSLLADNAASSNLRRAQAVTLRAQSQALFAEANYQAALDKANDSIAILHQLMPPNSGDGRLDFELSHSLDRKGEALAALERHNEALEAFQAALKIRQQLADATPTDDGRQRDLAVTLERAGDELYRTNQIAKASDMYVRSLAIRKARSEAKPNDLDAKEDLAVGYDRMALIDGLRGRTDDQIAQLKNSIELRKQLVLRDSLNIDWLNNLAINYERTGLLLTDRGDQSGARDTLKAALDIRRELAERSPDVPQLQFDLARAMYFFARCSDQSQAEKVKQLQQAFDILSRLQANGKLGENAARLRARVQSDLSALQ
jgi:tetratricopeptide (TPR) repeat protein